MKIAIIGAGAMGSAFGAVLCRAGLDVTLIDVSMPTIDALNKNGLKVENKAGALDTIKINATLNASDVGVADLVILFVKCYHTESAVKNASPLIGKKTTVLSLQNGWGNAPRIGEIIGAEKVIVGVTYHSATVVGPGHIRHSGTGPTNIGEMDGRSSTRIAQIAEVFSKAGLETKASTTVIKEIWSKLALNVCTLPTSALLRFCADELVKHEGTMNLMRTLLAETVEVAKAQSIDVDFNERWESITGLLNRISPGAKSSMLQDVEAGRRTEIDVINQAIVTAGRKFKIPTPANETMVNMVRALEETFKKS